MIEAIIPQCHSRVLSVGHTMKAFVPGLATAVVPGKVVRVDRRPVDSVAGPYVTVYGLVANRDGALEAGMQGKAKIHCGKTTLLSLMWESLARAVKWEIQAS